MNPFETRTYSNVNLIFKGRSTGMTLHAAVWWDLDAAFTPARGAPLPFSITPWPQANFFTRVTPPDQDR